MLSPAAVFSSRWIGPASPRYAGDRVLSEFTATVAAGS